MKYLKITFIAFILFCSFDSGCGKNYHEEIKFVNNSNKDVILTQSIPGFVDSQDSTKEVICGFRQLDIIQAGATVNYFEGKVNSIEDMLKGNRVFSYYIIDPHSFPQGEILCDSFDFKAKYLKKFEPNIEDLRASDFTYYYP